MLNIILPISQGGREGLLICPENTEILINKSSVQATPFEILTSYFTWSLVLGYVLKYQTQIPRLYAKIKPLSLILWKKSSVLYILYSLELDSMPNLRSISWTYVATQLPPTSKVDSQWHPLKLIFMMDSKNQNWIRIPLWTFLM